MYRNIFSPTFGQTVLDKKRKLFCSKQETLYLMLTICLHHHMFLEGQIKNLRRFWCRAQGNSVMCTVWDMSYMNFFCLSVTEIKPGTMNSLLQLLGIVILSTTLFQLCANTQSFGNPSLPQLALVHKKKKTRCLRSQVQWSYYVFPSFHQHQKTLLPVLCLYHIKQSHHNSEYFPELTRMIQLQSMFGG